MAQNSHYGSGESEDVILMAATHLDLEKENMWYLDTSCSNHITCNNNWFVKLDEAVGRSSHFTDNNMVTSNGMGNIRVKKKDGQEVIISNVLYVPSMSSNLISFGQLLDKNYTMKLEGRELKVFGEMSRLIL